jgi:pimeloyl-ACP methyl ester carboxylesterase
MPSSGVKSFAISRTGAIAGAAAVAAATTALWIHRKAVAAERTHPPSGTRIEVDGVGVHYVERGTGTPVVLIHGNTVSLEDFEASGLLDRLASNHRVIAFDRPGFGHSDRPRDRLCTPAAQAELLLAALHLLRVDRPAIVGHSMGTLVALFMALSRPDQVRQLVLLSGYYYPTVRVDALLAAPVALPIVGDALRYTITALAARATLKSVVKGMFVPREVPPDFFAVVSREMMLRPSQIRANAEDAAFMMPAAASLAARYSELRLPVTIMAGAADGVVDPEAHSVRLHDDVPDSELVVLPEIGHMVHHATSDAIAAALVESALNDASVPPESAPHVPTRGVMMGA